MYVRTCNTRSIGVLARWVWGHAPVEFSEIVSGAILTRYSKNSTT